MSVFKSLRFHSIIRLSLVSRIETMNNSQRDEDFSTRSRGEGQMYVSVLCFCRNGSSLNYFGLVEGFSDQNITETRLILAPNFGH